MKKNGIYVFSLLRSNPLAGLIAGVLAVPKAYLLIHRKILILIPFHFCFKMFAWFYGFNSVKC